MLKHDRCSIALHSPSPTLVTRLQNEESEVVCIEGRGSLPTVPEEELPPEALTPGMVPHSPIPGTCLFPGRRVSALSYTPWTQLIS